MGFKKHAFFELKNASLPTHYKAFNFGGVFIMDSFHGRARKVGHQPAPADGREAQLLLLAQLCDMMLQPFPFLFLA